ncbi:hypothetical protein HMEPL2_29730 [Vreelandella aquamarina]|jgi:TRAP-type C4-dicarboxylate transport system substrate-binding protein|uniref:Uncharacterized protein n=1 Tax=Vreelandella aquamarina TaxID=77097 RepID=A0A6F8XEK9_9GAMM|nr:hypothetical protein [Halomonas meridiana]BCB72622.1 hypothetical protein HMEPL2_29730 [Halomonas meridiana]
MRNIHRAGTIALALSTALIAESAVATTLSYGSYVSRSHTLHTDAVQPFFEAIEQDTDSSLRFRLHTDGTGVLKPKLCPSGLLIVSK